MTSIGRAFARTAVAAVLAVAPVTVPAAAHAAGGTLLSLRRPVVASSTLTTYQAARAVDGYASSRWASTGGALQWLRVDLGAVRQITGVRVSWGAAYAVNYRLQVSTDGLAWHLIWITGAGNGGADAITGLNAEGRYLRLVVTRRGPASNYSVAELQVYGNPTVNTLGLDTAVKKNVAMELVSSAENSSLDWRAQFGYIEDIGDGRGYTGGIIGFCSGTDDMLAVVRAYTAKEPRNPLAAYLPALRRVDRTASHAGLDPGFPAAWRRAAADPVFQRVQEQERDTVYFTPAVRLARADGLRALGQFAYYDAAVMHGANGLAGIRAAARRVARTPADGGGEVAYLNAFLDARVAEMRTEAAHDDTSRVDTGQRVFLRQGNLDLNTPLTWQTYGDTYRIP